MSLRTFKQDPDAVLDYTLNWSAWLAPGDTITSATATVSPAGGLTVGTVSNTVDAVTVWVSGGSAATKYDVTVHVITNGAREDDRTFTVEIKEM
ncbi:MULTISPECIES: phage fiber-tail adaptor protein [Mycobacteroides]|uniref:phage fiber-tail adaptor protein n=1 Tax=Mycobacteroides abscessus TaxID=36809 RepID=UPI0008AA42F0|nr:hypothetical protein BKG85_11370 [Mycobacteroides chelonae]